MLDVYYMYLSRQIVSMVDKIKSIDIYENLV